MLRAIFTSTVFLCLTLVFIVLRPQYSGAQSLAMNYYASTSCCSQPGGESGLKTLSRTTFKHSRNGVKESCDCIGQTIKICKGETATLSCANVEGCAEYCAKWSPNQHFVNGSTVDDLSITVAPEVSTSYTFSISDSEGRIVQEVVFSVIVGEPFEAFIVPSNPIACTHELLQISAFPQGESFSYDWNDIDISPMLEPSSRSVSELGEYRVTVTNTATTCEATATFTLRDAEDADASAEILAFFRNKGFLEFDIEILGLTPFAPPGSGARSPLSTDLVRDEVGRFLLFDTSDPTELDLKRYLESILSREYLDGIDRKGYITGNESFCQTDDTGNSTNIIAEVEAAYQGHKLGFWIHLWEAPDPGASDKLFIQAITVAHDGNFTPDSDIMEEYVYGLVEEVKAESETFDYTGKSEQLIDILVHQLADFYDVSIAGRIAITDNAQTDPIPDCVGQQVVQDGNQYLNATGLPITLPNRSMPSFAADFKNYDHDNRAVVGFVTADRESWHSWGTPKNTNVLYPSGYHQGFSREKNPKGGYRRFPQILTDNGCFPCYFGRMFQRENGGNCEYFELELFNYRVNGENTPVTIFPESIRAGTPNLDFDATGERCAPERLDYQLVERCIQPLSLANFNEALENGRFNPFGENGILFKINIDDHVGDEIIYGRFEGFDALAPMTYYLWDCWRGGWVRIESPPEPLITQFDILRGLWNMIFVDDNGFLGHTSLDIISAVPIIGIPADLFNAVWYLVEGDYTNASFALVGILPLIGDGISLYRAGNRMVLESGGVAYKIRGILRTKCPDPFGGSGFSTGLVAPILALNFTPPCLVPILDFKITINNITRLGFDMLEGLPIGHLDDLIVFLYQSPNGTRIARLIEDNPLLIKTWIKTDQAGLSLDQKRRLFDWLSDGSNNANNAVALFAAANPVGGAVNLVEGWKIIDEIYFPPSATGQLAYLNQRRFDAALINRVANLAGNSTFLQRLNPQNASIDALRQVLERFKGKSIAAPNNVSYRFAHLDFVDQYLQSLEDFATTFHDVPGFNQVMTDVRTGAPGKIDGVVHQMRVTLANPQNITRFEPPLGNEVVPQQVLDDAINEGGDGLVDYVADTYAITNGLTNGRIGDFERRAAGVLESLNETKSYHRNSFIYIARFDRNREFVNQLKAYFSNQGVLSMEHMNYIFDARKLELSFGNQTDAIAHIKNAFKGMFQSRTNEIFQAIRGNNLLRNDLIPDFSSLSPDEAYSRFLSLIADVDSPLYDFIKIQ